jgi:hypothetical protein
MNNCIDTEIQEMLPDLAHGSLDDRARRRVEAHLAGCESCREDLDVIRMVKGAAVFAPAIDVDRVVRQIPPYRMIVPGAGKPARTRVVQWLVAAGLVLAVVGGGSLMVSRQGARTPQIATAIPDSSKQVVAKVPAESVPPAIGQTTTNAAAPAHAHALALASNLDDLSDGNIQQLMSDMDQFDALPAAEPEPVIAVDSGDSL